MTTESKPSNHPLHDKIPIPQENIDTTQNLDLKDSSNFKEKNDTFSNNNNNNKNKNKNNEDKTFIEKKDIATETNHVIGRTPSGETFVVPHTEDMISTLFDPRISKTFSDFIVLAFLAFDVFLFFWLSGNLRMIVLLSMFIFWRTMYNAGIGYLLQVQSKHTLLIKWAIKYHLFDKKTNNRLYTLIRKDLTSQLGNDYNFDKVPIEFNTWLVFRRFVDLVLMNDFMTYFLFALSTFSFTSQSPASLTIFRWIIGLGLILFNIWVKLDAHRVVKDYAWYWGDFFFLVDSNLTFDGVFEMAPHPMYSIGYAGYYGISIICASYFLLFVSIVAHAAQFIFLLNIENPHIDKTYNPPPLHKRFKSQNQGVGSEQTSNNNNEVENEPEETGISDKGMIIFHNFRLYRFEDIATLIICFYTSLPYFLPKSTKYDIIALIFAILWKCFHIFGLSSILISQSKNYFWTKQSLKFGKTPEYAFEQWRSFYNLVNVCCYTSLWVVVAREIEWPPLDKYWSLRYVIGSMLIALQVWTSVSIYQSLGEYGWFFGDFFLPSNAKLTYSGIYRYLNNPERLIGNAAVWGCVLISNSRYIFLLACLYTIGNIVFIKFVEIPHMRKLYGEQIRKEAGLSRSIRRATKLSIPIERKVKDIQGSIDKVLIETASVLEDFLDQAKPKLRDNVGGLTSMTKVLLRQYPRRLIITHVAEDLEGVDTSKYSLQVVPPERDILKVNNEKNEKELLQFKLGESIFIKWKSDNHKSPKDWIGMYRVGDNASKEVTDISSKGRWSGIEYNAYNSHTGGIKKVNSNDGEIEFCGDALFWEKGQYEFRLHHNGNHTVLAISEPFEIVIPKVESDDVKIIEKTLLPLIQSCFSESGTVDSLTSKVEGKLSQRNDDGKSISIPPKDYNDDLWDQNLDESKIINRVTYAIKETYDIEFANQVVAAETNVHTLASRLAHAKHVLKPFISN